MNFWFVCLSIKKKSKKYFFTPSSFFFFSPPLSPPRQNTFILFMVQGRSASEGGGEEEEGNLNDSFRSTGHFHSLTPASFSHKDLKAKYKTMPFSYLQYFELFLFIFFFFYYDAHVDDAKTLLSIVSFLSPSLTNKRQFLFNFYISFILFLLLLFPLQYCK